MTEWIKCSDRLPENGEYILLTYSQGGQMRTDLWCERGKWMEPGPMDFYGESTRKVTHWMPYPEPPEDK